MKHRVELPGEVAAQLGAMREQNRRVVRALEHERARVERLTSVVKTLHEILSKLCPGSCESIRLFSFTLLSLSLFSFSSPLPSSPFSMSETFPLDGSSESLDPPPRGFYLTIN